MNTTKIMLENLKKSLSEATDDELARDYEELKEYNALGPSMEEILRENKNLQY